MKTNESNQTFINGEKPRKKTINIFLSANWMKERPYDFTV
jgi:hypothetical protein